VFSACSALINACECGSKSRVDNVLYVDRDPIRGCTTTADVHDVDGSFRFTRRRNDEFVK
jgi:hypothetical protein